MSVLNSYITFEAKHISYQKRNSNICIFYFLTLFDQFKNQSRTNGPINAHLTITQVKNKSYCLEFFQNICSSTPIKSTT